MLITDSQVHLWEAARPDRPWSAQWSGPMPGGAFREEPFGAEEMLGEMDATGVDRAIIVPPNWSGYNNLYAIEVAARYPQRFAVMGRFNPKDEGAEARLESWLQQPGMLGIRMSVLPYLDWSEDGSIEWFWKRCEDLGLPVMVAAGGQCHRFLAIARRHEGLHLIIDHLAGRTDGVKGSAAYPVDDLLSLAGLPLVCAKVSCVPYYSAEPYPYNDLQPVLHRVFDAYGPRRLLWGADFTRLPGTYGECLQLFNEGLDFLSAGDKEWILGKTAAAVLNWPDSLPD